MAGKRKYEKCISELIPENVEMYPDQLGSESGFMQTSIAENELNPHIIEVKMMLKPHAKGCGNPMVFPDTKVQVPSFPHKHAFEEYFYFIGTDPENPDDLGGTVEFWLGEGEEAEGYTFSKPTTVLLPKNTVQFPSVIREVHKPFLYLVNLDTPMWAAITVPKIPSAFNPKKVAGKQMAGKRKYEKCVAERDITGAAVFPSHKGKSHVVLQHGMQQNALSPHFTEVNLIYGAGIGWGSGDIMQYPHFQTRSLPHKHGVTETYCFVGIDTEHPNDLGGTVEFWIGEGKEAEEYIITKPTLVFIPPNTVHLPLYVREVHNPFVLAAILDTPLWAGRDIENFPPGFKNFVDKK